MLCVLQQTQAKPTSHRGIAHHATSGCLLGWPVELRDFAAVTRLSRTCRCNSFSRADLLLSGVCIANTRLMWHGRHV